MTRWLAGTLGTVRSLWTSLATWVVVVVAAAVLATPASVAAAPQQSDDDSEVEVPATSVPEQSGPLVPVPAGCTAPDPPRAVFLGTVTTKDYRTVRFEIDQVRSGEPEPFAVDGQIDIRYGLDAQYLEEGEQYLVGAVIDPVLGLMTSRVTDPIEDFGGDEVIGLSETDVDCPEFENPKRTLWPDGSEIGGGVFDPLRGSEMALVAAIVTPLGVALAAVFALALLRGGGTAAFKLTARGLSQRPAHRPE